MGIPNKPRVHTPPLLPLQESLIPRSAHDSRRAKYNCSCGNNTEAKACTCFTCQRLLRNGNSSCSYYGRCVEPLAWNIEHEPLLSQASCPLYFVLPKELRDLIFIYALTDSMKARSFGRFVYRDRRHTTRPYGTRPDDIATHLLRTCRAIYLETWMLPLSLNSYGNYDLRDIERSSLKPLGLYPWQLALVQSLDITLQQVALEGKGFAGSLHDNLLGRRPWQPEARHQGVYVAPKRYKLDGKVTELSPTPQCSTEGFCFLPAEEGQERHFLSHVLGKDHGYSKCSSIPWSSAMRVLRARPIVHLTLRIPASGWWTWTEPPSSSDELQHLGLDPAVGNGDVRNRPTSLLMRVLADRRRSGNHPHTFASEGADESQGWAATIGSLPDLKRLELVLETFTEKRAQLEDVVEAAETWRFPIANASCELTWDGHVDHSSWSIMNSESTGSEDSWHRNSNTFDVRTIRFTRKWTT